MSNLHSSGPRGLVCFVGEWNKTCFVYQNRIELKVSNLNVIPEGWEALTK